MFVGLLITLFKFVSKLFLFDYFYVKRDYSIASYNVVSHYMVLRISGRRWQHVIKKWGHLSADQFWGYLFVKSSKFSISARF